MDGLKVGEYTVNAGVTVAQRKEGQLEFDLSAYGLGHSLEKRWLKRKGESVVSGQKPEIDSPIEPEKPVLDSTIESDSNFVNIIILKVTDLDGNEITELEDSIDKDPESTATEEETNLEPEVNNPDGLSDAEMVVLLATSMYKSGFRKDKAESDTRTVYLGSTADGIRSNEYDAAVNSLNAAGIYLKRSAITVIVNVLFRLSL